MTTRALVEALEKLIDNYFEPWGSWKTAWWEFEVGDDKLFSGDNLLQEIRRRLTTPDVAGGGERKLTDEEHRMLDKARNNAASVLYDIETGVLASPTLSREELDAVESIVGGSV